MSRLTGTLVRATIVTVVALVTAVLVGLAVNIWWPRHAAYAAPPASFGNGMWLVGADIPAGGWTATPTGGTCLYGIEHDGIERFEEPPAGEQQIIYLALGDLIDTEDCGRWQRT